MKNPSAVVDIGSYTLRGGWSGEPLPAHVLLASEIPNGIQPENGQGLRHMVDNVLQIDPAESSILVTESPLASLADRKELVQNLFDEYGFASVVTGNKAVLSLHHSGRTTGLVLHCGHENTWVVPVFQSVALPNSTFKTSLSGITVTEGLSEALTQRGYSLGLPTHFEEVNLIKEKLCFVATTCHQELSGDTAEIKRTQRLPDGQFVVIDQERFSVPECLFQRTAPRDGTGITLQELCIKGISAAGRDLQSTLYKNIVLSGGSALMPGMAERLELEIRNVAPPSVSRVRVDGTDKPEHSSWIGGSILSSISSFDSLWITKREYEEVGVRVVDYKCF